jgi:hypothetical protein
MLIVFGTVREIEGRWYTVVVSDLLPLIIFLTLCAACIAATVRAIWKLWKIARGIRRHFRRVRKQNINRTIATCDRMSPEHFTAFVGHILTHRGVAHVQQCDTLLHTENQNILEGMHSGTIVRIVVCKQRTHFTRESLSQKLVTWKGWGTPVWFITTAPIAHAVKVYAKMYPWLTVIDRSELSSIINSLPNEDWYEPYVIKPLLLQTEPAVRDTYLPPHNIPR